MRTIGFLNQTTVATTQQKSSRVARSSIVTASQQPMRNFDNGAVPVDRITNASTVVVEPTVIKSYRVSPFDALKFNGGAPEKVNSRLAMVSILLAAQREMNTGETVLHQLQHPDWRVIIAFLLITHGTMVQVLKGAKDEDFGMFSVTAEKVNGRLAMLGFAGLMGLEYYSNVPFF